MSLCDKCENRRWKAFLSDNTNFGLNYWNYKYFCKLDESRQANKTICIDFKRKNSTI